MVITLFFLLGTTVIEENATDDQPTTDSNSNDGTCYKLVGIIVHLGQANGGHYYSFIQHKYVLMICFIIQISTSFYLNRNESDPLNTSHWYKFDDTDVSECKMDDDEELRSQCFGGDNPPSAFDQPAAKRYCYLYLAFISIILFYLF